jgi:hypothetical protein
LACKSPQSLVEYRGKAKAFFHIYGRGKSKEI